MKNAIENTATDTPRRAQRCLAELPNEGSIDE